MPRTTPDENRFRRLYERHHEALLRYFFRRADPSSAEDLASEVFLVAWRRIDEVPPGEQTLPWLYGVARRVLSNRRRGTRRLGRLISRIGSMGSVGPIEPDRVIVERDADREVLDALDHLSQPDQEVLRLAAWEGLSTKELALAIGCRPATAEKRLYRAKGRLARELGIHRDSHASSTTAPHDKGGGS